MTLWSPPGGASSLVQMVDSTMPSDGKLGTMILSNTTADVEGSWTTFATTSGDAVGLALFVGFRDGGVIQGKLLDVCIDDGSNHIFLENLMAGYCQNVHQGVGISAYYYFPIWIKDGSVIEMRLQCSAAGPGPSAHVGVALFGEPRGDPGFVGSKVTTFGINNGAGASYGTDVTCGTSGSYGTAVTIGTTSADSAIKYLQIGQQGSDDSTAGDQFLYIKINEGTNTIASELFSSLSTDERGSWVGANALLSHMLFNIAPSTNLQIATQSNAGTAKTLDYAIYGVE